MRLTTAAPVQSPFSLRSAHRQNSKKSSCTVMPVSCTRSSAVVSVSLRLPVFLSLSPSVSGQKADRDSLRPSRRPYAQVSHPFSLPPLWSAELTMQLLHRPLRHWHSRRRRWAYLCRTALLSNGRTSFVRPPTLACTYRQEISVGTDDIKDDAASQHRPGVAAGLARSDRVVRKPDGARLCK